MANVPITSTSYIKESPDFKSYLILSLPEIKKLKITNTSLTNLPENLEKLKIETSANSSYNCLCLNDLTLETIKKCCPLIKKLKIADYKSRFISDYALTNEGIIIIGETWPNLRSLEIFAKFDTGVRQVNDSGITKLFGDLTSLTVFGLQGFTEITDISTEALCKKFPKLTKLSLGYTNITDNSLNFISSLEFLFFLNLRNCKRLSEYRLTFLFQSLHKLLHLDLSNTSNVTDDVLIALCIHNPGLLSLFLQDADITTIEPITNLNFLNKLIIVNCKKIEKQNEYRSLSKLKKLRILSIVNAFRFRHDDLCEIMDNIGGQLIIFRLDGCKHLNDESFYKIARHGKKIRNLYMREMKLSTNVLQYSKLMHKNLKHLAVSNLLPTQFKEEISTPDKEFRIVIDIQGEFVFLTSE